MSIQHTQDSVRTVRPVQSTIARRRSVRRFRAQAVSVALIQRLLVAAVQAPNHRRTRPWRFFVVKGKGPVRQSLAELARVAALSRAVHADASALTRAEAKAQELAATPVLLFAYSISGRDSNETLENFAAVCCGIQNLLLAADEEGLASGWSTGGVCAEPGRLASVLGADPAWTLVGLLHVGFVDDDVLPTPVQREGPEALTWWLE